MIDLYTWGTPNGHKIPIMLEEAGLTYAVHPVNLSDGEQHSAAFHAINPNEKIPAIVDRLPAGDVTVFESGAILMYLAERTGRFLPVDPAPRMECLSWLFWQVGGLGPMLGQWGYFSRQTDAPNLPALQRYFDESIRLLGVLDARLGSREFLAGDYSIADIANFTWAKAGLGMLSARHPELADRFPHLNDWIVRIDARPAVQAGLMVPG